MERRCLENKEAPGIHPVPHVQYVPGRDEGSNTCRWQYLPDPTTRYSHPMSTTVTATAVSPAATARFTRM